MLYLIVSQDGVVYGSERYYNDAVVIASNLFRDESFKLSPVPDTLGILATAYVEDVRFIKNRNGQIIDAVLGTYKNNEIVATLLYSEEG